MSAVPADVQAAIETRSARPEVDGDADAAYLARVRRIVDAAAPPPGALPQVFTVDDVAAHFGVNRSTICDAIQRGDLKAGRVGRRYFVLPSAVAEWCSRVSP